MGGSNSSRRVVIEDGIQLSEGVVDRLSGKEEPLVSDQKKSQPTSAPVPTQPQQLQTTSPAFEEYYSKKIKELEERNAASQRATLEEFAKAVQEVEKKFVRNTGSPVCQDLQEKVFKCYTEYHKNTLNCSSLVKEFTACVEKAQLNAVIRKG